MPLALLILGCVPHYGPVYSWAGFNPEAPRQLEATIPRDHLGDSADGIRGVMRDSSCSDGVEDQSGDDPIVLVTRAATPQVLQGACLIRYTRGAILVKYNFASRVAGTSDPELRGAGSI